MQPPAVAIVSGTPLADELPSHVESNSCDTEKVHDDEESVTTTDVASEIDVADEVADDVSETDAEPVAETEQESESITDLNTSDIAKDQFVRKLALNFSKMASMASGNNHKSSFQSVSLPKVSISSYASRIYKYLRCTDECFVLCLVYIDRIAKSHSHIEVTDYTSHRLLFVSAVVAAKFHDDTYASNEYFARVGGIETTELNALEAEFLQLLDWKLYVGPSEYTRYLQILRGVV